MNGKLLSEDCKTDKPVRIAIHRYRLRAYDDQRDGLLQNDKVVHTKLDSNPEQELETVLLEPEDEPERFTFFWGKESVFSQHHPFDFTVDNATFNSAEQYMMFIKAITNKDTETAELIMASTDPVEQKRLGRQSKKF